MNEINLNPLSRSAGIDSPLSSIASHKAAHPNKAGEELDSIQFSNLPDFSAVEKSMEDEFTSLRDRLQGEASSPDYPALEMIDRLSHMLAINLGTSKKDLPG